MFKSTEIAALKEQITALESELTAAKVAHGTTIGEAIDLKASLEAVKAEAAKIPDLEAKVTAEKARADKAAADLAAANAEADKKIEAEVVSRLAAAGAEPIARDPSAKGEDPTPAAGLTGIAKARAALAAKRKK